MVFEALLYIDRKCGLLASKIIGNYPIEKFYQKALDYLSTCPEIKPGGPYVSVVGYSKGPNYISINFFLIKSRNQLTDLKQMQIINNKRGFIDVISRQIEAPYEGHIFKFVFLSHKSIKGNMKRMYEVVECLLALDNIKI